MARLLGLLMCYEKAMPSTENPFLLVVTDFDRGVFSVEGPLTDDRPWHAAVRFARDHHERRITCVPTRADRDSLAADYRRTHRRAGVPPGSIVRPHS